MRSLPAIGVVIGIAGALLAAFPARAEWNAVGPDVEAAARDPWIAGALAAVNAIDRAAMSPEPAAFAAFLVDDLAVDNPQDGVSVRGATAQRSAAGRIRCSRDDRIVEYAGVRGDMALPMGEEVVRPAGDEHATDHELHRRCTDDSPTCGSRSTASGD